MRPVQHMTLDYVCSQASFEAAQLPPVHQTKPAMKALKVLPGQFRSTFQATNAFWHALAVLMQCLLHNANVMGLSCQASQTKSQLAGYRQLVLC